MNYTEQEFEEAKAYLRDRIRNEQSMSADVLRLLELYAAYLLTALFGHASNEEIEAIIAEFVEEIMADCEMLACDEHDRKEMILIYMNSERHGDTLEGRIRKRADTFFNEVYAVFLAGKLMNLNKQTLLSSIKSNLKDPWNNEILKAVREKQKRGEVDQEYDFDEPHYGKGVPISSLTAIDRITSYAIADAWTYWRYEDASEKGAKGYFVVRGSTYPCDTCQEAVDSGFHPMSDTEHLVPLHLNCVCMIVYSYVERL